MAYLIIQSREGLDMNKFLPASHLLFAAGAVTGFIGYASSMATGLVCAAVNIMDAKEPQMFAKMVFFEFVAGSIGILGMAMGFLIKEKARSIMN